MSAKLIQADTKGWMRKLQRTIHKVCEKNGAKGYYMVILDKNEREAISFVGGENDIPVMHILQTAHNVVDVDLGTEAERVTKATTSSSITTATKTPGVA